MITAKEFDFFKAHQQFEEMCEFVRQAGQRGQRHCTGCQTVPDSGTTAGELAPFSRVPGPGCVDLCRSAYRVGRNSRGRDSLENRRPAAGIVGGRGTLLGGPVFIEREVDVVHVDDVAFAQGDGGPN